MKITDLKDNAEIVIYADALVALDSLKGNLKIKKGNIVPTNFWWKILWRFIKPLLVVALRNIAKTLDKPIEELIK